MNNFSEKIDRGHTRKGGTRSKDKAVLEHAYLQVHTDKIYKTPCSGPGQGKCGM